MQWEYNIINLYQLIVVLYKVLSRSTAQEGAQLYLDVGFEVTLLSLPQHRKQDNFYNFENGENGKLPCEGGWVSWWADALRT